jgi:TonB family protein
MPTLPAPASRADGATIWTIKNDAGETISVRGTKFQRLSGNMPQLPPELFILGPDYVEEVNVCVDRSGAVSKVTTITSTHTRLNRLVCDTVKDWKFEPMTINDEAVPFCYRQRFVFKATFTPPPYPN